MKASRKDAPAFRDAAHQRAAAGAFVQGASLYDDARPTYPPAVAALVSGASEVLDVGCGTGKLTETLLVPGRKVFALDPSADMVSVFARRLPGVPVWRACAEASGVASARVDAITCAQTWHWVDAVAASREADRVVRDGGALLLCWNTLDVRHPWVLRLSRIMHSGDVLKDGFYPTVAAPWRLEAEHRETWLQPVTTHGLFELMATRSYWLRAGAATREKMAANLTWYLFERLGCEPGQVLPLPYRTDAFCYRRG
ncbi:class I SAM-dependent methyltransferase [Corynebacterium liangguodongii]|uniref:SAM-dependent methyltransferase n=1 Tax=Corynebacterium liangguodongii TaxID=2079535 RepID=A0A2S0WDW9_9CORY|nr:class I SAM-dependent methyltransferase [Corynebacterium liangguodongii]AWB83975.1 SAM-dependent methyltransferase [Corynebacterium liangguodongii]PWB99986.1 class I SAM-dependent methyltransferase [Corynebacterium liangguodongii]